MTLGKIYEPDYWAGNRAMFRMRLAVLMSGENISRDFEKHLQYSTSKRGELQGFFSDNTIQTFHNNRALII